MSDARLRDELERAAEHVPTFDVPGDTYRRARRRRRTEVVIASSAAAAAVVAVLALVVGLTVSLPGSAELGPSADRDTLGLPDRLPVPQNSEGIERAATGAVGIQAAAFLRDELSPPLPDPDDPAEVVLVDAATGAYRLLELPGTTRGQLLGDTGDDPGAGALALSPDGASLAYPKGDALQVLDLESGGFVLVSLPGAVATSIQWSSTGGWIVWSGHRVTSRGRELTQQRRAGRIDPDRPVSTQVPLGDLPLERLAIAPDGTVAISGQQELTVWDGSVVRRIRQRTAVTDAVHIDADTVTQLRYSSGDSADPTWQVVDLSADASQPVEAVVPDELDTAYGLDVVGWEDALHPIVSTSLTDERQPPLVTSSDVAVASLTLDAPATPPDYRVVSRSDVPPTALTVASQLIAGQGGPVERPLPAFAAARDEQPTPWLLMTGAGVVLVVGGLLLWRRQRSRIE